MKIKIQKYQPECAPEWNAFIKHSINGTFLMERDFMDYHNDRFHDASLMIYRGNDLHACIPANSLDKQFYSHQGLSYGGIILIKQIDLHQLQEIVKEIVVYLKSNFNRIEFRWQPEFYNVYHENILSTLKDVGFNSFQAHNNLYTDLNNEVKFSSKKTAGYRNEMFNSLRLVVNHDFKSYWEEILVPQLNLRHDTAPVHSVSEIELLASRFPDHIKQYLIYDGHKLLAGVTFFFKGKIVKSQYAATTMDGMKKKALDFLYMEATKGFINSGFDFLDYGHVNHPDGSINRGLQRFKEELGAVNQPIYRSQWTRI